MEIKQFYDEGLAHGSYAIVSDKHMAIVDPARDPQPYFDFAVEKEAVIVAVFETHPHADFVSSHLEIHKKTGATIYTSRLVGADYPHQGFDDGDEVRLGLVTLKAMNTPGHSPDSISILLVNDKDHNQAIFTGDTLFVGDVGRPDLRENAGNITAQREELARMMYHSTREKIMKLEPEVLVYPAHGNGSLCGKNLSDDLFSTIGRELKENYALQPMSEDEFVKVLTEGQPFIPKYFGYNVDINKVGAENMEDSVSRIERLHRNTKLDPHAVIVDVRPEANFKKGHIKGAINIQDDKKFETWLGSIVSPDEKYYIIASNETEMQSVILKAAKIGYEKNLLGVLENPEYAHNTIPILDIEDFRVNQDKYQIIDIRNPGEVEDVRYFEKSVNIPLPELRERVNEIATSKPVVVHCAGGYRSSAGTSIVEAALSTKIPVFDLSVAVEEYKPAVAEV